MPNDNSSQSAHHSQRSEAQSTTLSGLQEALQHLHVSALQLQRATQRLEQAKRRADGVTMPEYTPRLIVNSQGRLMSNEH